MFCETHLIQLIPICQLCHKLKLYGITDKYFACFKSYLSNRKQYIQIGENSKADQIYYLYRPPRIYYWSASVSSICNRPAKSISMILIFLFNVKDNKPFFSVVNKELLNINDWLTSNKPSLNVEKQNIHSSMNQLRKTISLFAYQNLSSITMK